MKAVTGYTSVRNNAAIRISLYRRQLASGTSQLLAQSDIPNGDGTYVEVTDGVAATQQVVRAQSAYAVRACLGGIDLDNVIFWGARVKYTHTSAGS